MQAAEAKLKDILEGNKQYIVPLFQRTYSWDRREWEIFWKDLFELYESNNSRSHFIGSIVNMPITTPPQEGVNKYLLIDGQQRLTTIFILLSLLRDQSETKGYHNTAEEIKNTFIVNQYKNGLEYYKLIPTQCDRKIYEKVINSQPLDDSHPISKAYRFFEKKIKLTNIDIKGIMSSLTNYLSIVSIVLSDNDNPYLVFESLNAKGRALTQADLIRNYFFMRIPNNNHNSQDTIYNLYWKPMEELLKDKLTEFIRHFLMKDGLIIKENDIYYILKEKIHQKDQNAVVDYLITLSKYSRYYDKLLNPTQEKNDEIKKLLKELNQIEVTTSYPLLLNFYNDYEENQISLKDFIEILKILENYLVRRFICNYPTNALNKIFPTVYTQIKRSFSNILIEGLKKILGSKGYPKDVELQSRFNDAKMYGSESKTSKTKLILEKIEESYEHKEPVPFDNLTIEHIMPQTLTDWWKNHLGEEWATIHDLYLNVIGNLTLTAYNPELSNANFEEKKQIYLNSHLELNKYFNKVSSWKREDIEKRSACLSEIALEIWPYFGEENSSLKTIAKVTGKHPKKLCIIGQNFKVDTWQDVLLKTLNTIADLVDSDEFESLLTEYPNIIGKEENKFRRSKQLKNNTFVETNLSAQDIYHFCYRVIDTLGLSQDDLEIEIE